MSDIYRMFVRPEGNDGERGADLTEQYGDAMAQAAVAHLAPAPADRVIEIGFGPGLGLQVLARTLVHGHVTGVDPSALMHRRAALRNAAAIRAGRMTLMEGTVDALPFAGACFDAALAMDNLHFWARPIGRSHGTAARPEARCAVPVLLHPAIGWQHIRSGEGPVSCGFR